MPEESLETDCYSRVTRAPCDMQMSAGGLVKFPPEGTEGVRGVGQTTAPTDKRGLPIMNFRFAANRELF